MVRSVSASAEDLPTPDAPRSPLPAEAARTLAQVSELMGASPADAQADTNKTMAMREMALNGTDDEPEMPAIEPGQLRELIEGLAERLHAIGYGSAPALLAAK